VKSLSLILALLLALTLAIVSLFVGVSNVSLATLFAPDTSTDALRVLLVSRIPRTLALILAGSSMAIAGLIMQMLVRNRFVEPSTAGTTESAGLGLLTVTLIAPDTPIFGKMLVAAVFALRRHHLLRLSFRSLAIARRMDDGGFFRRAARPL
jgi:iron complex transport system permease protein